MPRLKLSSKDRDREPDEEPIAMPVNQPPSYFRYFTSSPRREPHWRWEVSNNFLRYSQDVRIVADPWLLTAWNVRRTPSSPPGTRGFYARAARDIWLDNSQIRWELEARILLNQSRQEIADVMVLPAKVILAYERLFFDVRERLAAKDYIVGYVLKRQEPLTPQHVGRIWAFFAYFGGVFVLEDLVAHYRELQLTDYSYLLAEPEPRADLTPLHAAIERALLVELTRDLDLLTSLAKIGYLLSASPGKSNHEEFDDEGEQFTAGLTEFDQPVSNEPDFEWGIA